MSNILEGSMFTLIVGFALIVIFFVLTHKKKKPGKVMDVQLLNKRILEFKSEPLIDDSDPNLLGRRKIETAMPEDPNCLNLAKVNYMNLLESKELQAKAEECIRTYGVGSCGPRGFYGTIDVHINLENKIAEFLGLEETVLYSYGFSTISSAIGAYCKKNDYILSDEEISFPAVQGFLSARSTVIYFKHNNTEDLERKLNDIKIKERAKKKRFRKFLVVEGIYMKTGQICPLPKLMEISKNHKMRIFLNETYSFGVLGKTGKGITEHFNVDRTDIDMIMGSLETSLGSVGGFCAGRSVIIEHQRLSGLGYCFSASLPPFLSYVPLYAIDMFDKNPQMFGELQKVSIKMHNKLDELDDYVTVSHPISPLKVISLRTDPSVEKTEEIFDFCATKGVYVLKMEDRIQFHVNKETTDEEMKRLIDTLSEAIEVI